MEEATAGAVMPGRRGGVREVKGEESVEALVLIVGSGRGANSGPGSTALNMIP